MKILSLHEAAEFLRIRPSTLKKWRIEGRGPKSILIGRKIVFDEEDLVEFLNSNRETNK